MILIAEQLLNHPKYNGLAEGLVNALYGRKINYRFIRGAMDIWLRDFMPIPLGRNRYLQYHYYPDYLKDYPHLRTDSGPISQSLGLDTIHSDLIMDGGNVILSPNCLIMCDKVVWENRHQYTRKALVRKLHELFGVDKVVLIGWDKQDRYGHADGMVRFIDEQSVLLSDFSARDPNVIVPLRKAGLSIQVLELEKKNISRRRWAYINFLQTPEIFLLPKLNIPEDDMALQEIKSYYPSYADQEKIFQLDCTEIVRRGGALNCISWQTQS
ncbi:MAG TPA: agmatine deiminase family protein [Bacteroidales bacterium]|nr:agmatine deiminase family protein [Bacteroidales bacterium]HRZ76443.1 agmatine deiminase family protein [Bacteroidales bacterium]